MVTADTASRADEVLGAVRRAVPAAPAPEGRARMTLWTVGNGGSPNRHRRWVDTPRWNTIKANYPAEVGAALERIVSLPMPPEHGGRLLLWYGDPGTGKTTASVPSATPGRSGPTSTSSSTLRPSSLRRVPHACRSG